MGSLSTFTPIGLVGLPGSGKTTLATTQYPEWQLFDDPDSETLPDLLEAIQRNRPIVITDPNFCDAKIRLAVEAKLGRIHWRFFENDLETCLQNCRQRYRDGRHEVAEWWVRHLSRLYAPPTTHYRVFNAPIKTI